MHPGRDIVVIGASAGGVDALRRLVGMLPPDLPAALFVVLHIWGPGPSYLPEIIARAGPLPARRPENGDPIAPGAIYVAPPDEHMLLERDRIVLVHGPRENRTRPAINPLFRSAATEFGPRVVAILLSGMLDDGVAGLWAVKRCGGVVLVQDPAEATYPDMPLAALQDVAVDATLPVAGLAQEIVQRAREPIDLSANAVSNEIQIGNEGAKMSSNGMQLDKVGKRSVFTCPECNGALWEIEEGVQPIYRCHVGHAYSPGVLADEQARVIEQSLWSALRALKESAALDERVAARSDSHGLDKAAAAHRRNAEEKYAQADHLMAFLRTFGAPRAKDIPPAA